MIIIKPETMELWCEDCKAFTEQGLVYALGQYMCLCCGFITVFENLGGLQ